MKLIKSFLNPSVTEDISFDLIEMKLQHSWTGGSGEASTSCCIVSIFSMLLSTQYTGKKRVESGRFDFIKDFLKFSMIEHKNSFANVCDITY